MQVVGPCLWAGEKKMGVFPTQWGGVRLNRVPLSCWRGRMGLEKGDEYFQVS